MEHSLPGWVLLAFVLLPLMGILVGLVFGWILGTTQEHKRWTERRIELHGEPMKGRPVDHNRPVWDEEAQRRYDEEIARTAFAADRDELLRAGAEFGAPRTADDRPVRHTPRRQP